MNRYELNRKSERMMFSGVPETPKMIFGNDGNGEVQLREVGRQQKKLSESSQEVELLGSYEYCEKKDTFIFELII